MNKLFYIFRFFLVPDLQLDFFTKDKKKVKTELHNKILEQKKSSVVIKGKTYLLYYTKQFTPEILLCKFAREKEYLKYNAGDLDIQMEEDLQYPFQYVIIDFNSQVIMVEKKTTLFREAKHARAALEEFFSTFLSHEAYTFSLDAKSSRQAFWSLVTEYHDQIYGLTVALKSPNLFGAQAKAQDILKEVKELHNATEVEYGLSNKSGKLVLLKEGFGDIIDYIVAGGGRYMLKVKDRSSGESRNLSSTDNITTVTLTGDPEELPSEQILKCIEGINAEDFMESDINDQKEGNAEEPL